MSEQFLIVLDKTVGIYGHDEHGAPWATFSLVNGTAICAVCSKEISRGWMRGKVGVNFHVCSEHIQVYEKEASHE